MLQADISSQSSTSCLCKGSETFCTGKDRICIRLCFPEELIIQIRRNSYMYMTDSYSNLNRIGCQLNDYNSLLQEYYASHKNDMWPSLTHYSLFLACYIVYFVNMDDVRGNVTHCKILFGHLHTLEDTFSVILTYYWNWHNVKGIYFVLKLSYTCKIKVVCVKLK